MKHYSVLVLLAVTGIAAAADSVTHYGTREHVRILDKRPIELTAKLDPTATHAVLKVRSIKFELHSDSTWVHFVVDSGDVITLEKVSLDRPLLHDHKVHIRDGGVRHEPVVMLDICVGNQQLSVPFTLLTRRTYTPAMLLGKPQIDQLGTVQPDARFLHEPNCAASRPAPPTSAH